MKENDKNYYITYDYFINPLELDDFNIMLSSMIIMFIIWGLIDTLFFID